MIKTMTSAMDWRTKAQELKIAKAEYMANYSKMSQYEQERIIQELNAKQERDNRSITAAAIAEWKAATLKLARAKTAAHRAWVNEKLAWDTQKLTAEMGLVRNSIEAEAVQRSHDSTGPDTAAAALRRIYDEAVQTSDKYKIRAAVEVLKTALPKFNAAPDNVRVQISGLAKQAQRDQAPMRVTEEMRKTVQERDQAYDEAMAIRKSMEDAHTAITGRDAMPMMPAHPLEKAMNMIYVDDKGEVFVLPPDHPDVRLELPKEAK